ncbi:MAG: YbdD/YjiX family protein [Gammaproteobacteria bacterium]|nr:YbdD/YjiX family protein [Gammaproteobacteria bacterium]
MLKQKILLVLKFLRQLSGDDAYERYLVHHAQIHPDARRLSRREFFKQEQERKWNGVRRCC